MPMVGKTPKPMTKVGETPKVDDPPEPTEATVAMTAYVPTVGETPKARAKVGETPKVDDPPEPTEATVAMTVCGPTVGETPKARAKVGETPKVDEFSDDVLSPTLPLPFPTGYREGNTRADSDVYYHPGDEVQHDRHEDHSLDPLLPERYPQYDLFICDVADAVLKDIMPQMEHPFYSLSKRPETAVREYRKNGQFLRIVPSVKGLATIYDKDILIYCISQLIAKLNQGQKVSKRVQINLADLLRFINRGTAGKDYDALQESMERLRGTVISTNIRTGEIEQTSTFGLIESATIERKQGNNGRIMRAEVVLSDWVFNAIRHKEVLTLHRDYFRLRKPTERRIYEIARKHCGHQKRWSIKVPQLLGKTGAKTTIKEFARTLRELEASDHLPDYHVVLSDDTVVFLNRETMPAPSDGTQDVGSAMPPLRPESYETARQEAKGWDVHYLEAEWRRWCASAKLTVRAPDAHFLKFCTSWFAKHGAPN